MQKLFRSVLLWQTAYRLSQYVKIVVCAVRKIDKFRSPPSYPATTLLFTSRIQTVGR